MFLLCFSLCHLVEIGFFGLCKLPLSPQPHSNFNGIHRENTQSCCCCCCSWTNDFDSICIKKHSIVRRCPRLNQHLQNRFLLKNHHHSGSSPPVSVWAAAKFYVFRKSFWWATKYNKQILILWFRIREKRTKNVFAMIKCWWCFIFLPSFFRRAAAAAAAHTSWIFRQQLFL